METFTGFKSMITDLRYWGRRKHCLDQVDKQEVDAPLAGWSVIYANYHLVSQSKAASDILFFLAKKIRAVLGFCSQRIIRSR